MPYSSQAQERWAHTDSGKKALGSAGVKEWDSASKGKKLPRRAPTKGTTHKTGRAKFRRKAHPMT